MRDPDTRSPGSASRPNPRVAPQPSLTPTPPPSPARRSSNSRPRAVPTPAPTPRPTSGTRTTTPKRPSKTPTPRPGPRPVPPVPKKGSGTGGSTTGKTKLPGGPVERNASVHPDNAPLGIHGHMQYRPGKLRRVPVPGEAHVYEFHFLYNPYAISIATGLSVDATFDPADIGTNFATAAQTISFELLINRVLDASGEAVAGRTGVARSELQRYGTLHDIEYLYRVTNGDPQTLYSTTSAGDKTASFSALTADVGYLYASPVEVHFGPDLRFVGVIQTVAIEHKSFNANMVPLLSVVNVAMTRVAGSGVRPVTTVTTEAK